VDRFEAHRIDLVQAGERLSGSGYRRKTRVNGRWVIGALAPRMSDPLHPSLGQNGLGRHVKNPILEGGTADIWDQAFHFVLSV
jgi:hypothetical protein